MHTVAGNKITVQRHRPLSTYIVICASLTQHLSPTVCTSCVMIPVYVSQVSPQQLGPALSTAPKVLGFSLHQVEQQLMALSWIQPDRQLLAEVCRQGTNSSAQLHNLGHHCFIESVLICAPYTHRLCATLLLPCCHYLRLQMILRAPMLLTWRARQLQTRTDNMAAALGISTHRMAGLLQQHPMLLPASSHLRQTLQLLQQLFLLAAASEQAGFGTGVVATLVKAGSQQQHVATPPGLDRYQQQQQVGPAADAAVLAAARQFALSHPRVLLMAPQELQARVASMQATSGLPAAQVAAMLISQPGLLLEERHV